MSLVVPSIQIPSQSSLWAGYSHKELFCDVDRSKAVWLSRQLGHNDYQLVKSLSCFLYQACEGDAVKKSLYKTLVEIQNNFNGSLVNEHPQYQEVKWG